jgi:hypothetical protein
MGKNGEVGERLWPRGGMWLVVSECGWWLAVDGSG